VIYHIIIENYLSFVIYPIIMRGRGRRWGRRRRCGSIGRQPKPVTIRAAPPIQRLTPFPKGSEEPLHLDLAEVEALRLVDLEELSFEEAGLSMKVSRNTVWRLAGSARRKIVQAITEGREIIIHGDTED
jgi:predicted DNA-binding protein (UPF0251 family)